MPNPPPKLSAYEVIEAFKASMTEHGLSTDDPIFADGKLHRIHIDGHKQGTLNGAYVLHLDGTPAGYFEDFSTGQRYNWKLPGSEHKPPDPEERKRIEAAKSECQSKRQREQAEAAQKATYVWSKAALAQSDHTYLAKKKIKPHGAKQAISAALILPLYGQDNRLVNLQFIHTDGNKRFLKNGQKKACFWWLGKQSETILIAEGFATAATLFEATGYLTVIAYDAGNLEAVAKIIRQRQPQAKIIVCADNDASGTGQAKANQAALAVDGYVALPPMIGDFNDYANTPLGTPHD
jgi:putative DNA primase/helicase